MKALRAPYVIAGLGGALLILAVLGTVFMRVETLKSTKNERVALDCRAEIDAIKYPAEAAILGDAYFGGERGYNLGCARAAYTHALRLDSKGDAQVWHQLGRIDFLEGDFDAALEKFHNQLHYFEDTLPNVHYMLGLTYGYRAKEEGNEDDWNESEASFRKYLEFNPTSPWARTDLSWVLFSEGKYEEMKPVLEEGLVHHPKHPWLLNMYGLALLNTGEHERAHAYFMDAYTYLRAYSAEDWGSAYPGNDPRIWGEGLDEMKKAVKHNLEITAKNSVHN